MSNIFSMIIVLDSEYKIETIIDKLNVFEYNNITFKIGGANVPKQDGLYSNYDMMANVYIQQESYYFFVNLYVNDLGKVRILSLGTDDSSLQHLYYNTEARFIKALEEVVQKENLPIKSVFFGLNHSLSLPEFLQLYDEIGEDGMISMGYSVLYKI